MKTIAQFSAMTLTLPLLAAIVIAYLALRALQRTKQVDNKLKHLTDQQFRPEAVTLREAEQLIEENQKQLTRKFSTRPELKLSTPPEFQDWITSLAHSSQRKRPMGEIHRRIIHQLELWRNTGNPRHAIPGYASPPENAQGCDYPKGWSFTSIARLIVKSSIDNRRHKQGMRHKQALEALHTEILGSHQP